MNEPVDTKADEDARGSRVLVWVTMLLGVLLLIYLLPPALVLGEHALLGTHYVGEAISRAGLDELLEVVYAPILPVLEWLFN
jgi:hypothetical protein